MQQFEIDQTHLYEGKSSLLLEKLYYLYTIAELLKVSSVVTFS